MDKYAGILQSSKLSSKTAQDMVDTYAKITTKISTPSDNARILTD